MTAPVRSAQPVHHLAAMSTYPATILTPTQGYWPGTVTAAVGGSWLIHGFPLAVTSTYSPTHMLSQLGNADTFSDHKRKLRCPRNFIFVFVDRCK